MPDALPIVLQQIDLDIIPGKIPPIVHVSEYDTGRQIVVNLFKDGHPFGSNSIESYTVKVEGSIGKYGFSENANWAADAEGVVVIQLTEAMTAIHGRVWTKIKLIKSESMQISTCGFWLDVDRAGVEAGNVISAEGFYDLIKQAAYEYLDENPIWVDTTLSIRGKAADAEATGQAIESVISRFNSSRFTDDAKSALLRILRSIAWEGQSGDSLISDFESALYPAENITGITAEFVQGARKVYTSDTLDSLRPYLTVVAHYSDSSSSTVTTYTLSGSLEEGTRFITVSYSGHMASFTVKVTKKQTSNMDEWHDRAAYENLEVVRNSYCTNANGAFVAYNGWSRTGYVPCAGASKIYFPVCPQVDDIDVTDGSTRSNGFFTADHAFIRPAFGINAWHDVEVSVPSNAAYFVISSESDALDACIAAGIIPYA